MLSNLRLLGRDVRSLPQLPNELLASPYLAGHLGAIGLAVRSRTVLQAPFWMCTLEIISPAAASATLRSERVECRTLPIGNAIPELDGLRGIAILLVMACHLPLAFHAVKSALSVGWVGVDLFFVLSGFLITNILLDSKGRQHPFRNFYARRILRIWPLYFLYLAFVFLCVRSIIPDSVKLWPFALFVQNSVYRWDVGPFLQPTWSLAVEEQFYLLWPLVILQFSRKIAMGVAAACFAFSPFIRAVVFSHASFAFLSFNTLVRLDSIALGCLIAILLQSDYLNRGNIRWLAVGMLLLGSTGFGICISEPAIDQRAYALKYTFIALFFGGAILTALLGVQEGLWRNLLRWSVLRYCGRISFALYLFNMGAIRICYGNHMTALVSRIKVPAAFVGMPNIILAWLLTFLAATLSWYLLESPILKLKAHFR